MKNIQIILNALLSKEIFEYVLIDRSFEIVYASSGMKKYLDSTPQKGDSIFTFFPEFVGSEEEIRHILLNRSLKYELESVHKGAYYINLSVEYYDKNTLLVILHNITDITRSQQKLLQYSNESILLNNTLQKILDNQNAILFVTYDNEISYINQQFMEYFSVKNISDIRRKKISIYGYFDPHLNGYDALFEKVNQKEEYVAINNDTFILQASWIEETHKLFTLTKVTKLTKEMQTDTLTGAYKKHYFNLQLEKIIDKKERAIVAVLDLDDFKSINDTYGHQIGDEVLKEFVSLIQNNIRGDDILARWGGEEFLLLLTHTESQHALRKIESLRVMVEQHNFQHIKYLTSSFGVAQKEDDDDLHSLLYRADKALYEAKALGKNKVVFKEK